MTPQIRKEIATDRAKADVRSLHEKIEDDRAGGASLPQIAEKLKLPVVTYDVDRSGREPNGKVVNFPHAGQVIPAAFNTDVGVDNDPIEADGGYVWYNVAGVTPSRDRTLDEVKDQVEARWRDDEIASRLKAKSAELLDKLKAGTPFDAVAASAGLKVQTADKLTRSKPRSRTVAAGDRGGVSHRQGRFRQRRADQPTEWVVFRVTDIATPKFDADSPDMKRIADLLKKQESEETLEQYHGLARVRSRPQRQPGGVCASARQQRAGRQLDNADRAFGRDVCRALCGRRGAGRMDDAGRRS